MRTKQDINLNQCDRCGKFVGNDKLCCCNIEGAFEGEAICDECYTKLKEAEK